MRWSSSRSRLLIRNRRKPSFVAYTSADVCSGTLPRLPNTRSHDSTNFVLCGDGSADRLWKAHPDDRVTVRFRSHDAEVYGPTRSGRSLDRSNHIATVITLPRGGNRDGRQEPLPARLRGRSESIPQMQARDGSKGFIPAVRHESAIMLDADGASIQSIWLTSLFVWSRSQRRRTRSRQRPSTSEIRSSNESGSRSSKALPIR